MAHACLVVVDMQNDFVTGSLGTPEAQAATHAVIAKVEGFQGDVVFTQDTHGPDYLETQEGKMLPVDHCIKGSEGWQLIPELKAIQEEHGYKVFEKPTFGSVELAHYLAERYERGELESVKLIGLCTDICVISNALLLKAFMPELPISVDALCCAGVTLEKHNAALETMKSCQIIVE